MSFAMGLSDGLLFLPTVYLQQQKCEIGAVMQKDDYLFIGQLKKLITKIVPYLA